jgi:hypothetical protein
MPVTDFGASNNDPGQITPTVVTPGGTSVTSKVRAAASSSDQSSTIGDFSNLPQLGITNEYQQFAMSLSTSDTSTTPTVSSVSIGGLTPNLAQVTAVPTPTNNPTPSYTFSSDQAGPISYGGSCSSATPTAAAGNNTITFNSLADGTYSNCTITVTNTIDSKASTPLSVNTFVVDTTPPTTGITLNPLVPDGANGWFVTQPSITLLATDLVSGVNAILFHWGSDSYSTYVSPFTAADGDLTLHYYATDNAGNSSTPATIEIKTDTVPPVAFTPTANPASWTAANSVAISFSTTDASSGIGSYSIKLDSGAYTNNVTSPYALDVTSVADGTHTVTVKAIDSAGNYTEEPVSIYLDKTAPVSFTPTASPASWTSANSVNISFSTTDATSGIANYKYKLDSGSYGSSVTSPYALDTSATADGTHTVTIKATDNAGNYTEEPVSIYLDKTPPTVSAGADKTAGAAFARVGTAADVTSGIATIAWTKVSGPGSVTFTPANALSTTISAGTDGSYVLRLTATDGAGNSAHSDMNLVWDTVHPIGTVSYSKNPVREGDSLTITATFSKVMADNPVTQIAISGANTVPATDMTKVNTTHYTYTYTVGSGDGTAIVTLSTGTDLFGNVVISDPITGGTFTVDNTPPAPFTPTAVPASWTSANSVAISFFTTDSGSGMAGYSIKLDSGAYTNNVTSPYALDVSATADGTHTVTVKAIDNVGNYREESVTIYLDKTPPTASMCLNPLNPDGQNGWYVTNPSVTLLATDLISGVNAILFHWDSGIDQTYIGSFNPPEGNNTLYYHAIDNAGNASTPASQVVKVNTTPPSFSNLPGGNQPINLTDGQVITDAIYLIQVAPGDPIGIERVEFSVDDNLICNLSTPNTNGVYACPWNTSQYHSTIKVTAYDLSGLTSTLTRTVITAWELPATGRD